MTDTSPCTSDRLLTMNCTMESTSQSMAQSGQRMSFLLR